MDKEKMIRKQIYLEPKQNEHVKVLSAREGKTEAEIIRDALDNYLVTVSKVKEDPLTQLIGIVETGERNGSVMHDRDIYLANHIEGKNGKK
jgi:hypothetical protein